MEKLLLTSVVRETSLTSSSLFFSVRLCIESINACLYFWIPSDLSLSFGILEPLAAILDSGAIFFLHEVLLVVLRCPNLRSHVEGACSVQPGWCRLSVRPLHWVAAELRRPARPRLREKKVGGLHFNHYGKSTTQLPPFSSQQNIFH